jgi:hypothetical protein
MGMSGGSFHNQEPQIYHPGAITGDSMGASEPSPHEDAIVPYDPAWCEVHCLYLQGWCPWGCLLPFPCFNAVCCLLIVGVKTLAHTGLAGLSPCRISAFRNAGKDRAESHVVSLGEGTVSLTWEEATDLYFLGYKSTLEGLNVVERAFCSQKLKQ